MIINKAHFLLIQLIKVFITKAYKMTLQIFRSFI